MEIVIQPTPAEVDSTVADIVEGYVRAGATTLGLATGSSPIGTYRELAARHRDAELDFSLARGVSARRVPGIAETPSAVVLLGDSVGIRRSRQSGSGDGVESQR